MPEYIDVTPTWLAVLPVLVEIAANAKTPGARRDAMEQLERMASAADHAVAQSKRDNA